MTIDRTGSFVTRLAYAAGLTIFATIPSAVNAQSVESSAFIPGQDLQIFSDYAHDTLNRWENGTLTTVPNAASPTLHASRTSTAAQASSSSSLVTGMTAAHALGQGGNYASGIAGYYDMLNFHVDGANGSTITPIHVVTTIHSTTPTFYQSGIFINLGDTYVAYSYYTTYDTPWWSNSNNLNQLASYDTYSDGITRTFDMVYNLTGADQTLGYRQTLDAESIYGIGSDAFGDVRLILPDNVTFTSASGAFLTAGVPEPASWAMMLGGFGLVGGAMRQGRKRAASLA